MKVLVTGAQGLLGSEFVSVSKARGLDVVGVGRADLDVTDASAVEARLRDERPDVVVHCAAYTAVDRAEGAQLYLTDGRVLIDGMSSWWSAIHGYRDPHIEAAVREQLERLPHVMFGGLTHEPAVRLCERLLALAPPGLDRVFLCDSGSIAVEVAIKMAFQYWLSMGKPERNRLLTVRGGYHGDTFATMAICDPVNGMHDFFGEILPRHLFAERPACRFEEPFEERHLAELAGLLANHCHEVAAVIHRRIVTDYPEAPEVGEASLALARFHARTDGGVEEAIRLLENLITMRPNAAVVPDARVELDKLRGRGDR